MTGWRIKNKGPRLASADPSRMVLRNLDIANLPENTNSINWPSACGSWDISDVS